MTAGARNLFIRNRDTMQTAWYGVTSIIFGILLFFPIRKLMVAMSINKLQRREKRAATEEENTKIRKKMTPIAAAISVTFAFVYNQLLLQRLMGIVGQ